MTHNEETEPKSTGPEDIVQGEMSVGEELLQELADTKDRKYRSMMKDHLKRGMRKVEDLKKSKANVDEKLKEASEEFEKVTKMTLSEFADYIKEFNPYNVCTDRTVDNTRKIVHGKLKMTFNNKY